MPCRRRILAAVGTATTAAVAGCSVLDGMPEGATIAIGAPEPTPESEPAVIVWSDLTSPERDLLERAFDGGHRTCNEVPDAADRVADRIESPETYLRRDGELYGLWLAITDMVFAGTTDPPPGECGLF